MEINPQKPNGPWRVLCDGERFLHAKDSQAMYKKDEITTWQIPARSPDLNLVERFWSWLRRKLLNMDMADLRVKKKPLTKFAYKQRVKAVLGTNAAKNVASNIAKGFRKTCKDVVKRKGAAGRG